MSVGRIICFDSNSGTIQLLGSQKVNIRLLQRMLRLLGRFSCLKRLHSYRTSDSKEQTVEEKQLLYDFISSEAGATDVL